MSRRNALRTTRAEERADRRYAERLWAAAARGDRSGFDRIFEAWLARSYAAAWHAGHDRCTAQERARTHMIEAVAASAKGAARVAAARR